MDHGVCVCLPNEEENCARIDNRRVMETSANQEDMLYPSFILINIPSRSLKFCKYAYQQDIIQDKLPGPRGDTSDNAQFNLRKHLLPVIATIIGCMIRYLTFSFT